jgi:GDP-L-fucose synthase
MSSDFFAGQSVLVTGSTGLTGNSLVNALLDAGADVRATVHRRTPRFTDDRIEIMECDLTDANDCRRAVDGVKYVFHAAVNISGAGSMGASPMDLVTPNVVMDAQMLKASYDAQVEKFLTFGSSTSYPDTGDRPVKEEEILQGQPYEKYYFVGWMKRFTEILNEMYSRLRTPMTTIVLRPANIYGPHDDFQPATSHVTSALIRKAVERQNPFEVWGTGDDIRDLLYVDDLADASLLAMAKFDTYMTMNIGLGKGHSVNEILALILEIDEYDDAEIVMRADQPTMIPIRLIDVGFAEQAMGFRAKTSLKKGLTKTIDWYRESIGVKRP